MIGANFENIVFVDEAAFQTGRFGLYHMRKAKAVSVKPRSVQRLNIWGGISWNGPTKFSFTTNLNSLGYSIILKKYLKPFMERYPGECFLIQDNDSKHSSASCVNTLNENNITWIKIPPYSPDINVIEHVWGDMRRYINKKYCDNIEKLRSRANKFVRLKLTQQRCQNHKRKLREILQVIINRNGDWSDF